MRLPARLATAAACAAAVLAAAAPAHAGSTRTANTPAQIDAYVASGKYAKALAAGYRTATAALTARLAKRPAVRKPAVVLDIDETTLSNMACLKAAGYELIGLARCVVEKRSTAIGPAKAFIRLAQRRGVKVVFITGRSDALRKVTREMMEEEGISGKWDLVTQPASYTQDSKVPYKSGARRSLTRRGFKILVNVGDQQSDLAGGFAERTVKLPNPVYLTT